LKLRKTQRICGRKRKALKNCQHGEASSSLGSATTAAQLAWPEPAEGQRRGWREQGAGQAIASKELAKLLSLMSDQAGGDVVKNMNY